MKNAVITSQMFSVHRWIFIYADFPYFNVIKNNENVLTIPQIIVIGRLMLAITISAKS